MTPAMTFGNWFSPFSRRQVFAAAMISLNTIKRAVSCDRAPRVRTVRCRTVANTLSIGFAVHAAGGQARPAPDLDGTGPQVGGRSDGPLCREVSGEIRQGGGVPDERSR